VGSEKLDSIEGVFSGTYALWRFDTPELSFDATVNVYPGITESGRWRANSDIRISWELVEDFFWDLRYWSTYDNEGETDSDTDYGVTTGIAWEY
jgi:hypothetical protein